MACSGTIFGETVPGAVVDRQPERTMEPLEGVLGRVLPSFPGGFVGLVFGRKGIGKTSLALTAFENPDLYVNEMTPDLYASYSARLKVRPRSIRHTGAEDAELQLDRRRADMVFDAVSNAAHPVEVLRQLVTHCKATGSRALAVAHTTKRGELAGREIMAHLVDTVVELVQVEGHRLAFAHKHRGGQHYPVVYVLGADGPALPTWDRYYSIEGTGPAFRVAPYPAANTRYARRLALAAKDGQGDLPRAPLAVSMVDLGELGGWTEPTDGAARRDFALGCGLPYFDADGELHEP